VAVSREESIGKSMEEMKGSTSALSQAEIKLRELERDATSNRSLYESFLARFKETSQQETLQTADSRIIERATTPSVPSAPNKGSITTIVALLGLALGGGIAYLLEKLDSGFRTNDQIERELGVPVLGVVPRAEGGAIEMRNWLQRINIFAPFMRLMRRSKGGNKRLALARLVYENPLSQFTEAVRALRMGIRFANVDRPAKIVLVTSALPAEGKSIIASNLAQQAAMAGERVLLIDMDLRHPVTTSIYAPEAKQGFVEVITENLDLSDVLRIDQATGLTILPSPRAKGLTLTSEILASQRVRDFLTKMARGFDLIILDSSPLLPVTDGRALIDAVDGVVLVIRWERTQREAVQSAIRQSHGIGDKLLGVAFNDVVARRARKYDYYKSGYYMKKYPHYYGTAGKA
jgi:capsular exopolysaccharide synthesis family protein